MGIAYSAIGPNLRSKVRTLCAAMRAGQFAVKLKTGLASARVHNVLKFLCIETGENMKYERSKNN